MAIVLPLLLLILFGIIDMGRMLQQQIQLTEAAREGARLGALNGTVVDVKAKVTSIVGATALLTYTPTGVTVCGAASVAGTDSTVDVARTFKPATPLIAWITSAGGNTTVTLHAKGVMSCVG